VTLRNVACRKEPRAARCGSARQSMLAFATALALTAALVCSARDAADATIPTQQVVDGIVITPKRLPVDRMFITWRWQEVGREEQPPAPIERVGVEFSSHGLVRKGNTSITPAVHTYQSTAKGKESGTTRVLFLLDTSGSVSRDALKIQFKAIEGIANSRTNRAVLIGFSTFSTDLAPITFSQSPKIGTFDERTARGLTTELYASLHNAIRRISENNKGEKTTKDRSFIFLFSDGKAEDTRYTHDQVVDLARRNGVVIYTFGYPSIQSRGRRARPLDFQNLRKLAEDTGGAFLDFFPREKRNNESALRIMLDKLFDQIIESGGYSEEFNLPPSYATYPSRFQVTLYPQSNEGAHIKPVEATFTVRLPAPDLAQEIKGALDNFAESLSNKIGDLADEPFLRITFNVTVSITVTFSLAWTFTFSLMRWRGSRKRGLSTESSGIGSYRLYLVGESGEPHRCEAEQVRLGRESDNDLVIPGAEVSKHHALLSRSPVGDVVVKDLGSANGVFVNDERVKEAQLGDGDILTIGNSRLRFVRDGPIQTLPAKLRATAVEVEREGAEVHTAIGKWWPKLLVRWPGVAKRWGRVAARLKERWPSVYKFLAERMERWANGEEVKLFDKKVAAALLIHAIYVFAPLYSIYRGKKKVHQEAGKPVAILETLRLPRRWIMTESTLSVGRDAHNDVVLDDGSVSRHHATITFSEEGEFLIRDEGSRNGVRVDNQKIDDSSRLEDGSVIELGDIPLRFSRTT
jgi:pSer/pThr/pTyr-binding forkhead associated (FHA) protein/uncharacterized protein YegL